MRLIEGIAPRFILGEDADLAEWLVHLHEPRFACRVRSEEDFTPEELADPVEKLVYEFGGGSAFAEFVWLDGSHPAHEALQSVLEAAADFVESFDEA